MDIRPAPSFWQRPAVQQFVPLATSFAFHLAVVGAGYLIYKTADVVINAITQEQIIIPDTTLVENADNGGVPNPGINNDSIREARQNSDERVQDAQDWAQRKSETLNENLMKGSADVATSVTPIGAGANVGGSVTGLNTKGLGEGGNLAPFGPPGGGGGQGKGLFGIPGGNVRRVAYVCDASGSMMGTLKTLLDRELYRAVEGLRASQAFNVVFFQDGEPAVVQKGSLLLASDKVKQQTYQFLKNYEVRGNTNPVPALEAVFPMRPELIFLLTDGQFDEADKVTAALARLNRDRKTRVNTILFVNGGVDDAAEATLKQIAKEHGGTYKLVRAADLQ